MIGLKAALISALGLRAVPVFRIEQNKRAHDAHTQSQSVAAGLSRIGRLGRIAAEAEAKGDIDGRDRAIQRQTEVRSALNTLARRLD